MTLCILAYTICGVISKLILYLTYNVICNKDRLTIPFSLKACFYLFNYNFLFADIIIICFCSFDIDRDVTNYATFNEPKQAS